MITISAALCVGRHRQRLARRPVPASNEIASPSCDTGCSYQPADYFDSRADAFYLLERTECRAGLRGLDAERRWLFHDVLRLHEYELVGGARHPGRCGK